MFELVKRLTGTFGVSGSEEEIRSLIINEIREKVDEIRVDVMGNLIAVKKGTGKKIMLAAHMDEIGVMVTYIDDKGYLRFSNVGWVSQHYALGQRVRFANGVTGCIFYEEKLDDIKNLKLSNLYIDIGATSREEAEKLIKIGDTACFVSEAVRQGDLVVSKALDNRAGCAVLIKVLQALPTTEHEVYFVFTVQEEVGLRGAKTAAYQLKPDMAVAIDVTDSGDTPECKPMEMKLGKGPAIKIMDRSIICHPAVKQLLEQAAQKAGVPFQYEIIDIGGCDAGEIQMAAGGIPTGAVSISTRYIHSPVEAASLTDMEQAVRLLIQAVLEYQ